MDVVVNDFIGIFLLLESRFRNAIVCGRYRTGEWGSKIPFVNFRTWEFPFGKVFAGSTDSRPYLTGITPSGLWGHLLNQF